MKEVKISTRLEFYRDWSELNEAEKTLCEAAERALENSYAVYSKFYVGSAVLFDDGLILQGANQENAVYPLGLCAERVALFAAGAQFPKKRIVALAVTTAKKIAPGIIPPFPCGSCRQTLVEFEKRYDNDIRVLVFGSNHEVYAMTSVKDILPFAFDNEQL